MVSARCQQTQSERSRRRKLTPQRTAVDTCYWLPGLLSMPPLRAQAAGVNGKHRGSKPIGTRQYMARTGYVPSTPETHGQRSRGGGTKISTLYSQVGNFSGRKNNGPWWHRAASVWSSPKAWSAERSTWFYRRLEVGPSEPRRSSLVRLVSPAWSRLRTTPKTQNLIRRNRRLRKASRRSTKPFFHPLLPCS